jgi:hypothetical protein
MKTAIEKINGRLKVVVTQQSQAFILQGAEQDVKYTQMMFDNANRNNTIELLEAYSKFLQKEGYLDTDWNTEPPYAIDEFLKTLK